MSDTTTINPPAGDAAHEAQVDQYIRKMKQLQEEMAADREEILSLQAETRAILNDVMATLKAA